MERTVFFGKWCVKRGAGALRVGGGVVSMSPTSMSETCRLISDRGSL